MTGASDVGSAVVGAAGTWFGADVSMVAGNGADVLFGIPVLVVPPFTGFSVGGVLNVGSPVAKS